ncbi:MAG: putative Tic20 family protein [Planctomycetota bacterium]|jgi:uncharacterized Tic20 family protein
MLMHLSMFAGYVVPFAGIVAPILMWQLKKDDAPEIDENGREIVNALISFFVYGSVAAILCLIVIGIPLLIAVSVAAIVFPIIGAIKANDGIAWRYPMIFRML